jgi:hypothetical protein
VGGTRALRSLDSVRRSGRLERRRARRARPTRRDRARPRHPVADPARHRRSCLVRLSARVRGQRNPRRADRRGRRLRLAADATRHRRPCEMRISHDSSASPSSPLRIQRSRSMDRPMPGSRLSRDDQFVNDAKFGDKPGGHRGPAPPRLAGVCPCDGTEQRDACHQVAAPERDAQPGACRARWWPALGADIQRQSRREAHAATEPKRHPPARAGDRAESPACLRFER